MVMKKRMVLILAVLAMFVATGAHVTALEPLSDVLQGIKADSPWGIIQVDGARELFDLEAAAFIDVRTPDEYTAGHIPGAVNIPLETIPDNLDKLPGDKDTLIISYCKSGWRANIGMVTLRLLGYTNTKGFNGSWLAWTGANHPVKEGSQP